MTGIVCSTSQDRIEFLSVNINYCCHTSTFLYEAVSNGIQIAIIYKVVTEVLQWESLTSKHAVDNQLLISQ